jgi:putative PIN family toxin of toxin-antitoxin system
MAESAHPPLRLVLDTNIVVAGLLWNGPRRWLLEAAIAGEVELYSSAVLLAELAHTLGYAKFAGRIEAFGTRIAALVAQYSALVSLVAPSSVPRIVAGDADDDHVIAAAVAARAELIVTGDRKHLLPIGSHQGIAIVSALEVVERLGASRVGSLTDPDLKAR